jgi:hypothetical protein
MDIFPQHQQSQANSPEIFPAFPFTSSQAHYPIIFENLLYRIIIVGVERDGVARM